MNPLFYRVSSSLLLPHTSNFFTIRCICDLPIPKRYGKRTDFQLSSLLVTLRCCLSLFHSFRLNVVCVIAFYFVTHLRDPGYVPHDAVFFTDQEEEVVYNIKYVETSIFWNFSTKDKQSPQGVSMMVFYRINTSRRSLKSR